MRTPPTAPSTPAPAGTAAAPAASPDARSTDVTALLLAWEAGDPTALDRLLPLVYAELRRLARGALRRERDGHTLQPTALVHEAFLRLVDQRRAHWQSRTQFFAVAAESMRRVLVDHARARRRAKRGGGESPVTLDDAIDARDERTGIDVLDLDAALTRLAALDPRKARLVELRFFAGLSIPEAALALGVSQATLGREWAVARGWLRRELTR